MSPSAEPASRRLPHWIVAGGLGLLLAGCGTPAATVARSTPPPASGTPSVTAPASMTAPPPQTIPADPSVPGATMSEPSSPPAETTVTGTVVEGAQPSCRNLQADAGGRWALTGEPAAALAIGDHVTVLGMPRPDLISPCGRVFVVTSVR